MLDERGTVAGFEVTSNEIAGKRLLALMNDTDMVDGIALRAGPKIAGFTGKRLLGRVQCTLG